LSVLFRPPEIIKAAPFTRLPERFRALDRTEWADANRGGAPVDSFLEGPSFGRDGTLYVVDIPFGRVFAISPAGDWRLLARYDGWPNGLKLHQDGRIFIADHRQGLLILDPADGTVTPLLRSRHSEGFKGLNDLHFAANGALYFTDQGQTGLHDPTGRVFRLSAAGRLEQLVGTVPSPNGLALNLLENQLFVAVTRANAVWRLPLMGDGSVSKAGLFLQLSGGNSGPDGLALDAEGGLVVAHIGLGVWRFDALGRPTHLIETDLGRQCTNVAFGGPDNRDLFITESQSGTILRARMPVPGQKMFGLS
jgi:gluconolactonase